MKTIGIDSRRRTPGLDRMVKALGGLFSVRFLYRSLDEDDGIDAWVVLGADSSFIPRLDRKKRACFIVPSMKAAGNAAGSGQVAFSMEAELDPALRGRRLDADMTVSYGSLPEWIGEASVLARKDSRPVWVHQKRHDARLYYSAVDLPEIGESDHLFQFFQGNRFMGIMPLWHFLRNLDDEDLGWEGPPLQACLMVDDPNLHGRTYGFVDYRGLVRHAKKWNYHISFATIPLDGWFFRRSTAEIFNLNPDRLSLLMHGNNHASEELGREYPRPVMRRMLGQALDRIERLERRARLKVCRVMVPPHGKCTKNCIAELSGLEYDAACIPRGALRRIVDLNEPLNVVGMRPVDLVEGLPVINRFPLDRGFHNSVLISALLRQPIIAAGHHQDFAGGLGLLEDVSTLINSLGHVRWSDVGDICKRQFFWKREDDVLRVKMMAKSAEIEVPEGVRSVRIEFFHQREGFFSPPAWRSVHGGGWRAVGADWTIPADGGQTLEIRTLNRQKAAPSARHFRGVPVGAFMRRQITELRDRSLPFLMRHAAGTLRTP